MRTGGVWYGIELDTLSYTLHHIVVKVRHKTNACESEHYISTVFLLIRAPSLIVGPPS